MEAHGDEDLRAAPTQRELELAMDVVIECILDHGKYPTKGRVKFDLYDYLLEHRDPFFAYELLVASMSSNTRALNVRIKRERKTVEMMLVKHLTGSTIVAEAAE